MDEFDLPEELPPDPFPAIVTPLAVRLAAELDAWELQANAAAQGSIGFGSASKAAPRWAAHFDTHGEPSVAVEGDGYVRWASGRVATVTTTTEDYGRGRAMHIADWDPARALAIVAFGRDLLDIHRPVTPLGSEAEPTCAGCRIMVVIHSPILDGQAGEVACASLIALAQMLSVPI